MDAQALIAKISQLVKAIEPQATVILYGSRARGDQRHDSDVDILVLLNQDRVSPHDETRIKYPLYELEFETGYIISPLVLSRNDWQSRHRITPFYQNVQAEGIVV